MAAFFRYFATLDLSMKVLEDSGERKVELHRRPLGVVGAIIPWNFPLLLLAFKMPPALLAGNTLVIKPAPTTPLSTLEFAALVAEMLPPGVVNVITDVNDLGDALTSHPDVAKISQSDLQTAFAWPNWRGAICALSQWARRGCDDDLWGMAISAGQLG
jgi:acyl-CoA reductase-like NAD-dependent aldehyde dehydrogenase